MSRNLVALMRLIAGQAPTAETKPFLQAGESRLAVRSFGAGSDDPIEAEQHEFFEGGLPLGGHDLRAMEESVGQIDGRLHGQ